jgi:hypothetical protein
MRAKRSIVPLGDGFGLRQSSSCLGFAEERKLLLNPVKEIAIIGAPFAVRAHDTELRHRVIPGTNGRGIPRRRIGTRISGAQCRMVRARFFNEGFDPLRRNHDGICRGCRRLAETDTGTATK